MAGPALQSNSASRKATVLRRRYTPYEYQLMVAASQMQSVQGTKALSSLLTDLVAYWKLDDVTWLDSVGSANLTNNSGVAVGLPKLGAGSAQFDGSNYLSLANRSEVQITGDFTIACWVRFGTINSTRQMIASKDNLGAREYTLFLDLDNAIRWNVNAGTIISTEWTATAIANTWYFVVATYRASDYRISLSVNAGTPVTTTGSSTVVTTASQFEIGARQYAGIEDYVSNSSRIDEVGIWKRVLTDGSGGEVQQLYNGGAGLTYPFA
jgi:hypothetical protein